MFTASFEYSPLASLKERRVCRCDNGHNMQHRSRQFGDSPHACTSFGKKDSNVRFVLLAAAVWQLLDQCAGRFGESLYILHYADPYFEKTNWRTQFRSKQAVRRWRKGLPNHMFPRECRGLRIWHEDLTRVVTWQTCTEHASANGGDSANRTLAPGWVYTAVNKLDEHVGCTIVCTYPGCHRILFRHLAPACLLIIVSCLQ